MSLRRGWRVWLAVVLVVGLAIVGLFAPSSANLRQGSTYDRSPSGYGAWYATLSQQSLPVRRWQRPLAELPNYDSFSPIVPEPEAPDVPALEVSFSSESEQITLVRVYPSSQLPNLPFVNENWVRQGNVVVELGIQAPAAAEQFKASIDSPAGEVQIETRRRFLEPRFLGAGESTQSILEDSSGVVVQQTQVGEGQWIQIVPPDFAANAYQSTPGNFQFLTDLLTEFNQPIWIDEYLHGYRDPDPVETTEESLNFWRYLAQTPIALLGIQAIVLLLVLIWGSNQRLGQPISPPQVDPDNTSDYIRALGQVLRKAESSAFVVKTVGQYEKRSIQRSLGLTAQSLDDNLLIEAWVKQTGRPAAELEAVLQPLHGNRSLRGGELLNWIYSLQQVRQHLPR